MLNVFAAIAKPVGPCVSGDGAITCPVVSVNGHDPQSSEQLSQLSPASHTPFPQIIVQSLSFNELQPVGQQPSLFTHETNVCAHEAVHVFGLLQTSIVQTLLSLQSMFAVQTGNTQVPLQSICPPEHDNKGQDRVSVSFGLCNVVLQWFKSVQVLVLV